MRTVLLAGPGGNWMGLLIRLILLVVLLKGGSVLYAKFRTWYAHRKEPKEQIVERELS